MRISVGLNDWMSLKGVIFRHQIGWRSGRNHKYEENTVFEDEGGDDGTAGDEEDGGEHHQVMMKVVIVSKCVLKSRSSLVQDAGKRTLIKYEIQQKSRCRW